MSEPIINEDEMIGYIMRKLSDKHQLTYEEVRGVLDAETDFLKEKGIADTAEGKGDLGEDTGVSVYLEGKVIADVLNREKAINGF